MQTDSSRWHEVTSSAFEPERRALNVLRQLLSERGAYQAWSNFSFVAPSTGHVREVDALVLLPDRWLLIEIKSLHGRLINEASTWMQRNGRSKRVFENPRFLAELKSKELRLLLRQASDRQRARLKVPRVDAFIYLSEPDLVCNLDADARHAVFGPPGIRSVTNTLPSIADLFAASGGDSWPDGHGDEELVRLLATAGISKSRQGLEIGAWELEGEPYETGPTWADHRARHKVTRSYRRVRIYLYEHESDEEVRHSIRAAAQREFEATAGVEHPGILRAEQLETHQDGAALVIFQEEEARRLDHYLIEHGSSLDLQARLDLVGQLADAVRYAHSRQLAHRALSPRAVMVTPPADGTAWPRLQIGEWQFARSSKMSGEAAPTTNAARHIERSAEGYLAPEYQDATGSFAADTFGVGALTYLILTGDPPARDREQLLDALARDGGLRLPRAARVPRELAETVRRATAPAIAERLSGIAEFCAAVAQARQARSPRDADRPETDSWTAGAGSPLPDGGTVVEVLGAGSTARALLVARGGDRVVVKVARSASAVNRLEGEARILGELSHPGIAALRRGPYQLGGRTAIEVEFAGHETLRARLKTGNCPPGELRKLGADLLDALVYLESARTLHRDIKPDNLGIIADPGGAERLVLFDFSHAGEPLSEITAGTRGYLDPHLGANGRRYDTAADRYAAAATLHEMVSGAVPVWGADGTAARYVDSPTLGTEHFPAPYRQQLMSFFERALAKQVTHRFNNADEMRQAWDQTFRVPAPSGTLRSSTEMNAPLEQDAQPQPQPQPRIRRPGPKTQRAAVKRRFLLTAGAVGVVAIWATLYEVFAPHAGSPVATLKEPGGSSVAAASFSPAGNTLATGDSNGNTYLWNLATRSVSAQILSPENNSLVNAIAFSPNGSIIATGENKEYLWNSVTRKLIASLSDPGGGHVASAAFSPGGNTIATLDGNGYVYIWDVATHSLIRKIPVFTNGDPGSTVVYSPNGRLLAVATGDPLEVSGILSGSETSNIEFLSVPEYQPVGNVEDPGNPAGVWSMAFSPDGKILAAGDGNGTTYLWNTQNSTLVGTVSDPSSVGVRAVTFSHDGKMLATGDMNGNSYTWRIPGYKLAATLSLPGASASSASVVSVSFSPDGQTLATASDLGVTDLWDSGQFNP